MTLHILLDSYPLGLLATPVRSSATIPVANWTADCVAAGHEIYIPEVIDYELRRELLRAQKTSSITELNNLRATLNFLPINSAVMLRAADIWATARHGGFSTGDPKKLDIDAILAAQALNLGIPAGNLIVATSNVRHISRFVPADLWSNIKP
jgi:predicted nucleic acid-binding protein